MNKFIATIYAAARRARRFSPWELSQPITAGDAERQRRSFAFGNANISNPDVTREVVDEAAKEIL